MYFIITSLLHNNTHQVIGISTSSSVFPFSIMIHLLKGVPSFGSTGMARIDDALTLDWTVS